MNTTSPNEKVKFSELNNESIDSDYAGSVFLMVIGEDEDNWPNKLRHLKYYGLYDGFKKLSNDIKRDFGSELPELINLYNHLMGTMDAAKKEIERIEHTTKLNGRCEYV